MKVKVSEVIGPALDWLAWKCAGGIDAYPKTADGATFLKMWRGNSAKYVHPSGDWSQGGPIIEREKIGLSYFKPDPMSKHPFVVAAVSTDYAAPESQWFEGPTPLIAAMRCFVASKLGDEVDVPDELL